MLSILALAAADIDPNAIAPTTDHLPHSHMHAPGEIDEGHGPFLLQITYTGEVIGNAAGGIKRGTRYLDNLDIVFEADMEKLAGWTGAQVHVYGLYNNGKSISNLVGDTQAISNIETGVRAFRLYEAWIEQKVSDTVSLKAGLYDLNSEFDALDTAGLFVNSPHGIGTDFAQSGRNGPSIFPSTSLAARLEIEPAQGWAARVAVLDGVPGDPRHPRRTAIKLGNGDGALLIGELQAPIIGGKLLVGHWQYTGDHGLNNIIDSQKRNNGAYVRAEVSLSRHGQRQVDAFLRLGTANDRLNMFDAFAGAGVTFNGWVSGRDTDEFGVAVAAAFTSDRYRAETSSSPAEVAIEATYRTRLAPWLLVQPNIHYIHRPSADLRLRDALVFGLRTEISFNLPEW